jgi:hypothetical protein
MVNRPASEVVLEPARGRVGRQRLAVSLSLWGKIADLARPGYTLDMGERHQKVMLVNEAARFVTALSENRAKAAAWPEKDRQVFQAVLLLLYQHDGLVINYR